MKFFTMWHDSVDTQCKSEIIKLNKKKKEEARDKNINGKGKAMIW